MLAAVVAGLYSTCSDLLCSGADISISGKITSEQSKYDMSYAITSSSCLIFYFRHIYSHLCIKIKEYEPDRLKIKMHKEK